jgi:hypothetical protein
MDGIPSGLTSVTSILPESLLIPEKGGATGPQVEIMPLPDNSFKSGDATAELLNTPFTLSLDIRGYEGAGGRDASRAGQPAAGMPAQEESAAEAMLGDAYTLSLGGGDAPAASDMARELTRMKSYEMLGKTARQTYRLNPQNGSAEPGTVNKTDETDLLLSGRIRNFVEQSDRLQGETAAQPTVAGAAVFEEAVREPLMAPTGGSTPAAVPAQNPQQPQQALISGALAFQLTPSDYETILSLEPDLQEALLNMLGDSAGSLPTRSPVSGAVYANSLSVEGQPGAGQGIAVNAGAAGQPDAAVVFSQPDVPFRDTPITAGPSPATPQRAPDGARLASMFGAGTDGALERLAPSVPGTARALSEGMTNLQKINELPFSLYLFGGVTSGKRPNPEEDEEIAVSEEMTGPKAQSSDYLRLSEAVKMASVLHRIYHGGHGSFPKDEPWYAPYVQYAVRHDIILSGEFDDFNDFATRAETAYIFSNSVPRAELPVINAYPVLADIGVNDGYGDAVYLLHKAGVLVTTDRDRRFHPENLITRSEAASMIGRIATPGDRKKAAG